MALPPPTDGVWKLAHPRVVQSALTTAVRGVTRFALRRALRTLALEIGAPVIDNVLSAHLNLAAWPAWFRPPTPDDPPRSHMCGFVFGNNASQPLSAEVESFLTIGEAPVVAGFGSAASLHGTDRYRAVANACEKLGRRCLLIGPTADVVAATPNALTVAAAPYARVFPAASVIAHHGGFGTCAEALRSGQPSLVTPFTMDQFDTAARIHDAGLGYWLGRDAISSNAMAAAIDSILNNASLRTAAHAAALKIAGAPEGADRAAELIQAL